MQTKLCTDCRFEKPVDEFGKEARSKDGLRSICKACARARTQAYKKEGTSALRSQVQPAAEGQRTCIWCSRTQSAAAFEETFRGGRVCNDCRRTDWERHYADSYNFDQRLKRCSKCGEWRSFDLFSRSSKTPGGLKPMCKLCAQTASRYAAGREKVRVSEKACARCGQVKAADQFYQHLYNSDGLSSWCKACSIRTATTRQAAQAPQEDGTAKTCRVCQRSLPLSQYSRNSKAADGYASMCKGCYHQRYQRLKALPKTVPEEKLCPKCGKVKSYRDFHRTRGKADGLVTYCKACMRGYAESEEGKQTRDRVRHNRELRAAAGEATLTVEMWEALLDICERTCPRCSRPFSDVLPPTVDHIVPLKLGGTLTLENVQPLCRNCNAEKNATEIRDYRPAEKLAQLYADFNLTV